MALPLSDYEDRAFKALLEKEKAYEVAIAQILRQALDDIRVEMSKTYEKYAVDGVLTKAQMTKYNRLATLEQQIVAIVKPATNQVAAILNRIPPEMYGEAFFRYAWAIDQATQVALRWSPLNRDVILENIDNPIDRIAVERYRKSAPLRAIQALQNGLIAGQSYTQMIKDFKKGLNILNYEAVRILRTEGPTAANAAQSDVYLKAREQGVDGKRIWDATIEDGRTRDAHAAADGQAEDDKGMFHVGGETGPYPGWAGFSAANRINERCRVRFQIEGFEPQLRRVKGEGILPYQTYTEWKTERKTWK